MRRFVFLALIALMSLSAGMFMASDASALKVRPGTTSIVQVGPCSTCSQFLINGNEVCSLISCRETGLSDPYGNEYVICTYRCRVLP